MAHGFGNHGRHQAVFPERGLDTSGVEEKALADRESDPGGNHLRAYPEHEDPCRSTLGEPLTNIDQEASRPGRAEEVLVSNSVGERRTRAVQAAKVLQRRAHLFRPAGNLEREAVTIALARVVAFAKRLFDVARKLRAKLFPAPGQAQDVSRDLIAPFYEDRRGDRLLPPAIHPQSPPTPPSHAP